MFKVEAILPNGDHPHFIVRDEDTGQYSFVLKTPAQFRFSGCSERHVASAVAKHGYEPVEMPLFPTLDAAWSEVLKFSKASD
jgi:hypothetical protein